jgi:hypothetical protein
MTLTIERETTRRGKALDAGALGQLFTEARTHNAFRDVRFPIRC